MVETDHKAKERALILGMPPDVHIPIGARNKDAIIQYIGNIEHIENIPADKALIVRPKIPLRSSSFGE